MVNTIYGIDYQGLEFIPVLLFQDQTYLLILINLCQLSNRFTNLYQPGFCVSFGLNKISLLGMGFR
jgi:hypothetical protein